MPAKSDDLKVRDAVETLEPVPLKRKVRSLVQGTALLIGLTAALPAHATTIQDFDSPGTAYTLTQHQDALGAAVVSGGPTGNFLRLAWSGSFETTNSIAFDLTDPGAYDQIVTEFDFRIGAGADGLGVALLSTSLFGTQGPSSPFLDEGPHPPAGSLFVGFNTFQNPETADPNNNFLRLYYDAQLVTTVAQPGILLSSGQWIHARFEVTATPGGGGLVSLELTPSGGVTVYPLGDFLVPTYAPYESRLAFGARTGGWSANHDIDNVIVAFEVPEPACSNGIDDDGDTFVDYPADPGCFDSASRSEVTACQDGVDNDGMPGIDFDGGASVNGVPLSTPDPQCTFAWVNSEATFRQLGPGCGIGPELALLLPALLALRHRRRES